MIFMYSTVVIDRVVATREEEVKGKKEWSLSYTAIPSCRYSRSYDFWIYIVKYWSSTQSLLFVVKGTSV